MIPQLCYTGGAWPIPFEEICWHCGLKMDSRWKGHWTENRTINDIWDVTTQMDDVKERMEQWRIWNEDMKEEKRTGVKRRVHVPEPRIPARKRSWRDVLWALWFIVTAMLVLRMAILSLSKEAA